MRSFVLTIDVEPVGRQLEPGVAPSWDGFERAVELLTRLRERIGARTGRRPRFSWFARVDPQIEAACGSAAWVLHERRALFDALEREGDEIGLHMHSYRWVSARRVWLNDHANTSWLRECLASAVEAFRAARGAPPRSFRFGDRYLDNALLGELERLGICYDLTVEAGAKAVKGHVAAEESTGSLPDTRKTPRHPYRPSRRDFRRPPRWLEKPHALWELPVTTACVNRPGDPFPRRVRDAHDMVHFNLGLDRNWIEPMAAASVRAGHPVIVSVARSGDLTNGSEEFRHNLERLAARTDLDDRAFVTPSEGVEYFVEFDSSRS